MAKHSSRGNLYDINIKKLESEIKKLKPKRLKPDSSFQALSREKLDSLKKNTSTESPPPTKYDSKNPAQEKKTSVKIALAPLDRVQFLLKPSPCLSSMKPQLVKPYQARPDFFRVMRDVASLEHQIVEGLSEERVHRRENYEVARQQEIYEQKRKSEILKFGYALDGTKQHHGTESASRGARSRSKSRVKSKKRNNAKFTLKMPSEDQKMSSHISEIQESDTSAKHITVHRLQDSSSDGDPSNVQMAEQPTKRSTSNNSTNIQIELENNAL